MAGSIVMYLIGAFVNKGKNKLVGLSRGAGNPAKPVVLEWGEHGEPVRQADTIAYLLHVGGGG